MLQTDALDHAQGPERAEVTLVEYGDFECIYCETAFTVVKRLQKEFSGQLKFVFRHFPLRQLHPDAQLAAEAAEAAGAQSRFWEMHDALFRNQNRLDSESLSIYASELGLDVARFDAALASHVYAERVHQHFRGGLREGVSGTPTFFVNGVKHEGDWSYEVLANAIRRAIKAVRAARHVAA
ncbi:MAG: DsbA family protein [Deltaproteobacteria bacterium]|nr:DsbA family protein [Deltaproteobacteria bacterium]